jgi:hypothetical protein
MGWQNILKWMVAHIPQIQSSLNSFMSEILIYYCHSQISELCQISKEFIFTWDKFLKLI